MSIDKDIEKYVKDISSFIENRGRRYSILAVNTSLYRFFIVYLEDRIAFCGNFVTKQTKPEYIEPYLFSSLDETEFFLELDSKDICLFMIESFIDWNSEYYFFSSDLREMAELDLKINIDLSFIDSYEFDGSTSLKYHGLVFRILNRIKGEYFFAVIPNLLEDESLENCVYFEYSSKIMKIFETKKLWSEI